jgi:hypothetical protein
MTIRLSTPNPAILVWMERGQIPTEAAFKLAPRSSNPTHYPDLATAVAETMRLLCGDRRNERREPWILCQKIVLSPADIRMHDIRHSIPERTIALS